MNDGKGNAHFMVFDGSEDCPVCFNERGLDIEQVDATSRNHDVLYLEARFMCSDCGYSYRHRVALNQIKYSAERQEGKTTEVPF